jgi:hypothetical protein
MNLLRENGVAALGGLNMQDDTTISARRHLAVTNEFASPMRSSNKITGLESEVPRFKFSGTHPLIAPRYFQPYTAQIRQVNTAGGRCLVDVGG